jgi:uncharacterized membrane protein
LATGVVSGTGVHLALGYVAVVSGAFLGMNFDSLLGASVQGRNKCRVCGKQTEELMHHGERTISESGIRYFENNVVNLVSTVAAAVISAVIFLMFVS